MAIVTAGVVPASVLLATAPAAWLETWSEFAADCQLPQLSADVRARTRLVILDCIGAIIAGSAEPEVAKAAQRLQLANGAGASPSPFMDAFLGGTAGTMLEIDEGNQYARGHPGIHVVPAVLATARQRPVSGADAMLATALGYEIGARIGIASKLRVTMHPHGTWGTTGAGVAIAKLGGADHAAMARVINIASSLGLTTSRRTMLEGATVRNTYAGFSNMLGMMAWELAQAGFTGEQDGVATVYGTVAADDWRPEEMTRDLGTRWEIARNYFKRHAACRYNHGSLDALADIVRQAGGTIAPEEVAGVDVQTYVWAAQLDHPAPQNMLAAKFSLPFSIATTLVNGAATLDAFRAPSINDPRIRALAAKVRVDESPAFTARLPAERPAQVTLRLTDGRSFTATAVTNKGDTEDPYSPDEVIAKFCDVTTPVIGRDRAAKIVTLINGLDQAPNIAPLHALCEVS